MRRSPILAFGLGTALALGAVELAFRAGGIRPPSRVASAAERRGDRAALERFKRERNSLGFHDHDWRPRGRRDVWRVAVLGDSFTEGARVARSELFTERIEQELNAWAGARRYDVMNVGRAGWGTVNQLEMLEELLADGFELDAVLVAYFINDATALDSNPVLVAQLNDRVERRDGRLNRVSLAWDWVAWRIRSAERTELTLSSYRESFEGDERAQRQWKRSRHALRSMQELSVEHGFRLGVVLFPVLAQLDERHELADLYDAVGAHCSELGVPFRSLLPAFLGQDARSLWLAPDNAHPNARGHEIAAAAILDFVLEAELVPLVEPAARAFATR